MGLSLHQHPWKEYRIPTTVVYLRAEGWSIPALYLMATNLRTSQRFPRDPRRQWVRQQRVGRPHIGGEGHLPWASLSSQFPTTAAAGMQALQWGPDAKGSCCILTSWLSEFSSFLHVYILLQLHSTTCTSLKCKYYAFPTSTSTHSYLCFHRFCFGILFLFFHLLTKFPLI